MLSAAILVLCSNLSCLLDVKVDLLFSLLVVKIKELLADSEEGAQAHKETTLGLLTKFDINLYQLHF